MPERGRFQRLGVACFEAPWTENMLNRQSVLPVLEFLQREGWINFFHRPVGSRDQFLSDIKRWATQDTYRRFPVCFLAFHGEPERLRIGRTKLEIDRLAEHLAGDLRGQTVYFGSCSTASDELARSRRFRAVLKRFRKTTKAEAVFGYVEEVDMADAAAFEILLFSWLAARKTRRAALRAVSEDYPDLCALLGFVAEPQV